MTTTEMYEDLVRRNIIVPTKQHDALAMPTVLKTVPTIRTYDTTDPSTRVMKNNVGSGTAPNVGEE